MWLEYKKQKSSKFKWFMIEPNYLVKYLKKYKWNFNITKCSNEGCLIKIIVN
jgi:hypothetical protein